jgi:hypothetical protein
VAEAEAILRAARIHLQLVKIRAEQQKRRRNRQEVIIKVLKNCLGAANRIEDRVANQLKRDVAVTVLWQRAKAAVAEVSGWLQLEELTLKELESAGPEKEVSQSEGEVTSAQVRLEEARKALGRVP